MYLRFIRSNNIANMSFYTICFLLMIAIIGSSSSVTNTAIASFESNISSIIDQNIRANTITSWNDLTSQLGIKENLSPPQFSRVYALVHISIYDSLLAAAGAAAAAAAAAAATAANREYNTVAFDNKSFYV